MIYRAYIFLSIYLYIKIQYELEMENIKMGQNKRFYFERNECYMLYYLGIALILSLRKIFIVRPHIENWSRKKKFF